MTKIFISYHHLREQNFKNDLSKIIQKLNKKFYLKDNSVVLGDIDPQLSDEKIYKIIREQHLKDSDVTIIILGQHTKCRKHIDKEIGASLIKYGSSDSITKVKALVVLLTNDFINAAKKKNGSNTDDYNSLITLENAGKRIYENCKNGYAVVNSISNILYNPIKLIKLIGESLSLANCANKKPHIEEVPSFMFKNLETCPELSKSDRFINYRESQEQELEAQIKGLEKKMFELYEKQGQEANKFSFKMWKFISFKLYKSKTEQKSQTIKEELMKLKIKKWDLKIHSIDSNSTKEDATTNFEIIGKDEIEQTKKFKLEILNPIKQDAATSFEIIDKDEIEQGQENLIQDSIISKTFQFHLFKPNPRQLEKKLYKEIKEKSKDQNPRLNRIEEIFVSSI